MKKDLYIVLDYNGNPIRVGVIGGVEVFCLHDLLKAMKLPYINVTNIMTRIPPDVYHRASTVDTDGHSCNTQAMAVTLEGAYLTLPRLSKVDLVDVMLLTRWMKTVKKSKMKKGA